MLYKTFYRLRTYTLDKKGGELRLEKFYNNREEAEKRADALNELYIKCRLNRVASVDRIFTED